MTMAAGTGGDAPSVSLKLCGSPVAVANPNPSFLCVDAVRRRVFVATETSVEQDQSEDGLSGPSIASGMVSAFDFDDTSGTLTHVCTVPSGGEHACYVSLHPSGKYVFVANYSSGNVASFPVVENADGKTWTLGRYAGPSGSFQQHPNPYAAADSTGSPRSGAVPERQEGPHAHAVVLSPDGRFLYAPDLGLDQIRCATFDSDTGELVPNEAAPFTTTHPGAGPRHMVFQPSDPHLAFVANELDSTLCAYAVDTASGGLTHLQTISLLPVEAASTAADWGGVFGPGISYAADLHISPCGRFVYASNRGHDSISVFSVDLAAALSNDSNRSAQVVTLIQNKKTGGLTPRNFTLVERDGHAAFLIVANQDTAEENIVCFSVDAETGMLSMFKDYTPISIPSAAVLCAAEFCVVVKK